VMLNAPQYAFSVKRCYLCKLEKPLSYFPLNRKRADGRSSLCKSCKKAYNAAYYSKTKERHNPARIERLRHARLEARERVCAYLREHPCVDCGETDIVVLDFDHQGNKSAAISVMIGAGRSWPDILKEIEKCEVVCSNDHRRRTAKAFGWHRALLSVASSIGRALDS
jgi:hypothetical protein